MGFPIPRLPPIQTTGDLRPLQAFEPALLQMEVMAIHLRLRPHELRTWLEAAEVFYQSREPIPCHVYVGPGHFSHRWTVGAWCRGRGEVCEMASKPEWALTSGGGSQRQGFGDFVMERC